MNGSATSLGKNKMRFATVVFFIPLCFAIAGCSLYNSVFKSSDVSQAKTNRTIWHSREQNVQIVKQDVVKGGVTTQNDHPILLDANQIRSALKSLEVRLSSEGRVVPVFTESELDVLGSKLSEGLAQAGPDEDVTFVIVGQRRAVYGIAKQQKVTTGRVFYREGKLNIIFGKMINDLQTEYGDYRMNPLNPGSRSKSVSHAWVLEDEPDIQFYAGGDMIRSDWVVLDLASMAAHEALGTKPVKTDRTASELPVGSSDRLGAPQETGQAQVPAYQAPAATQIPQTGKASKSIEERLRILNDLKNKKLITDEEYKAKRANILNDL